MRLPTRTVATTATAAVLLVGAGGVALATGAVGGDDDDLARPGTIAVDESLVPRDDDDADTAALAELATIDATDAADAALGSVGGGEALDPELEAEGGYLVWEVDVRDEDGTVHEITVDAGDGGILGTEIEDDEDEDEDEEDDAEDALEG